MSEFYEYEDAELRMKVPKYLRSKGGILYFAPYGRGSRNREIFGIAVDFPPNDWVMKVRRNALHGMMEPQQRLIRCGQSSLVPSGIETLTRDIADTGELLFSYDLLFEMSGRIAYLSILGRRDQGIFESVCREIVTSIHIKPQVDGHLGDRDRNMASLKEKTQMIEKKKGGPVMPIKLPAELGYLGSALTKLSRFDPETLNEDNLEAGDIVDASIRQRIEGLDEEEAKNALGQDCKVLKKWIAQLKTPYAPAGFVYGFVMGFISYGGLEQLGN